MDTAIALTYRRVSTYKQERDGVSLDVQTDQCIAYIRRQPGWRLGGDFSDTLTGRTARRKDYQQLLQEARQLRAAGKPVVIVTAALDRMGRDLLESVRSRKELKALTVPLHCVREGGVLSDTQANLYATIAQDESDRIGARVAGTRKRNRERGWRGPTKAMWGYIRAAATERERLAGSPEQVLRPDPRTAEYVRTVWQRVADGESVRRVTKWAAGLSHAARGGRDLRYATILKMLKNPVYIARVEDPERGVVVTYETDPTTGEHVAKRSRRIPTPDLGALELPSGRWEPLVTDEVWAAVHRRLGGHPTMPHQASGQYLLTGLLRCPKCGLRMQGRPTFGGQPNAGYTCSIPGQGCWYGARAATIDGAVLAEIERRLRPIVGGNVTLQRAMRAEWARLQQPAQPVRRGREATITAIIAKAKRRQDEMLSLLADRVISRDKYDRGVAAEQHDIDAAEAELAEIRGATPAPTLPPFDDVVAELGDWARALAGEVVPEQRDILARLIEKVVPTRIGYGKYRADIKWTTLGDALGTVAAAA